MNDLKGEPLKFSAAVYSFQMDGQGGIATINNETLLTKEKPGWIHLDYANEESARWLRDSPLIPDSIRDSLAGESIRPRLSRVGDGILLTLRSVNIDQSMHPDQMVTLRVYITDSLVISTRHRKVYALDEVLDDLRSGSGALNVGDWLVQICDAITDHASEFIERLHDTVMEIEDNLLEQIVPERGKMASLRKQLIILRRYMAPQRDVFSRLATERVAWLEQDDKHRMQEIADRLGRGLDDLDSSIARTMVLADEISSLLSDNMNRRTYTLSVLAMVFLPTTFLTGLFGVNLGGIPGSDSPWAFLTFCLVVIGLVFGLIWWLKSSKWL